MVLDFQRLSSPCLWVRRYVCKKRFDALQTLAIIQQEKIEVMPIVPAMLARFGRLKVLKEDEEPALSDKRWRQTA